MADSYKIDLTVSADWGWMSAALWVAQWANIPWMLRGITQEQNANFVFILYFKLWQ